MILSCGIMSYGAQFDERVGKDRLHEVSQGMLQLFRDAFKLALQILKVSLTLA